MSKEAIILTLKIVRIVMYCTSVYAAYTLIDNTNVFWGILLMLFAHNLEKHYDK